MRKQENFSQYALLIALALLILFALSSTINRNTGKDLAICSILLGLGGYAAFTREEKNCSFWGGAKYLLLTAALIMGYWGIMSRYGSLKLFFEILTQNRSHEVAMSSRQALFFRTPIGYLYVIGIISALVIFLAKAAYRHQAGILLKYSLLGTGMTLWGINQEDMIMETYVILIVMSIGLFKELLSQTALKWQWLYSLLIAWFTLIFFKYLYLPEIVMRGLAFHEGGSLPKFYVCLLLIMAALLLFAREGDVPFGVGIIFTLIYLMTIDLQTNLHQHVLMIFVAHLIAALLYQLKFKTKKQLSLFRYVIPYLLSLVTLRIWVYNQMPFLLYYSITLMLLIYYDFTFSPEWKKVPIYGIVGFLQWLLLVVFYYHKQISLTSITLIVMICALFWGGMTFIEQLTQAEGEEVHELDRQTAGLIRILTYFPYALIIMMLLKGG